MSKKEVEILEPGNIFGPDFERYKYLLCANFFSRYEITYPLSENLLQEKLYLVSVSP